MKRFVEGEDRQQATLLPACLDDYVTEDNPVRVIDVFIDELDLEALGFAGVEPEVTGRPAYHPATLLKIYLYGYLNRIQSSRRLERESQRNIELMWLTGRLMPDFKTIADFRRDNGPAIRAACAQFVVLCRNAHKHPKVRQWLDRHPRFTFHFTPTSCSWLNAVEGFFAKLAKRRLNRGVFRCVVDLQAAINRFVAETNHDPKPFTWTADPHKIIAAVRRGHQC